MRSTSVLLTTIVGSVLPLLVIVVAIKTSKKSPSLQEISELQNESIYIELSCAREFGINERMIAKLKSPIALTVLRHPNTSVKCFARCMIERFGFFQYRDEAFDLDRLIEVNSAGGLPENRTRYYADKCVRVAWSGAGTCEDFWQLHRCFHGSV